MRAELTVKDFEDAERVVRIRQARRLWRLNAAALAAAVALTLLLALTGGVSWFVYLALATWGCGLWVHYLVLVRHGDAHFREQQIRIEWRAERTKEQLR